MYPANTWHHKNHLGLLDAYRQYHEHVGVSAWPLILTGHGTEPGGTLAQAVAQRGLEQWVSLHGYVTEAELRGFGFSVST